jgi:uncharacterized protein
MKILVSEIPEEGLDLEDEETIESDTGVFLKAKLILRVERISSEVFLKGNISTELELVCSRCLKEFISDISIPLDLTYRPIEEMTVEEKYELSHDELDTGFYKNDELDLYEISKEQVLLSIPMKPLCSTSCKGICPKCGADLNEKTCGCDLKQTDPRLQILDKYLKGRKE